MSNIQRSFIADTVLEFVPRFFRLIVVVFPGVLAFGCFTCGSSPLFSGDRIYCQATGSVPYLSQAEVNHPQPAADAPIVVTGLASQITYNSATIQGTVNAQGLSTTVWLQYRIVNGPSKSTGATQTVIGTSGTEISIRIIELLPGATYYYRLVGKNDAGTSYGKEMSFTTVDINSSIAAETTPPMGAISINDGDHCTNSLTVAVNLSATDNTGVTGYYLSASATPPSQYSTGWTSIPSTMEYLDEVSCTLDNGDGDTTMYVWYKDASGNISDTASDTIVVDTTPPVITIQDPTADQTYTTTSETVSIGGNASDEINEISSVVWTNNRGMGNTERNVVNWVIPHVALVKGDNVITVKAADRMGNTGIATITITYTTGNNAPVVKTGFAARITTDLATLSGTVHAMGLATTTWFQYGTSSGHYSSMSPVQDMEEIDHDKPVGNRISGLEAGTTYYYRLVAQNSAGAASGGEMTFTTLPLKGRIFGKVIRLQKGEPLESAKLRLKGIKARKKGFHVIFSDAHGLFTCDNLDADTYDITVTKADCKTVTQTVELKEGEEKKIEIALPGTDEGKEDANIPKTDQQKAN
ncbi:MAG: hypothetical protein CV087_04755 [Candidatus Brocadia sp. WS118]|nr:MAG: hypothetical protein CV087_04755 [Candidatus Brocadia sp. WS118]